MIAFPHLAIADLFCGAGGTSTGALEAIAALGYEPKLTAINHWDVAIATHTVNHPGARHLCTSIDDINPRSLFKEGELEILWASPECTHHSVARGGKPINDQSRATAWCVVRWADALRPRIILVENVPEFETWGAIGSNGRPLASKRGATFLAWVAALESLGYSVDWRVLCAADYGDPTTRRRLFVQAVRGRLKNVWPEPTHSPSGCTDDMFAKTKRWVSARDIIDWSIPGKSVFERKKPLSERTMARIYAGLRKYGLKPCIITMEHGGSLRSVSRPLPTVTCAKGGAMALSQPVLVMQRGGSLTCEPHILPQHAGAISRPVDRPVPTVTCDGAVALVEPFLVEYYSNSQPQSVDTPLNTVTCKGRHALVQPEVTIDGARYLVDLRFRMLNAKELAAAQGFRADYQFTGTRTEQVKQIGNAVPRRLARSLCLAVLGQRSDISEHEEVLR